MNALQRIPKHSLNCYNNYRIVQTIIYILQARHDQQPQCNVTNCWHKLEWIFARPGVTPQRFYKYLLQYIYLYTYTHMELRMATVHRRTWNIVQWFYELNIKYDVRFTGCVSIMNNRSFEKKNAECQRKINNRYVIFILIVF